MVLDAHTKKNVVLLEGAASVTRGFVNTIILKQQKNCEKHTHCLCVSFRVKCHRREG